jgi:hypothetical protein
MVPFYIPKLHRSRGLASPGHLLKVDQMPLGEVDFCTFLAESDPQHRGAFLSLIGGSKCPDLLKDIMRLN